MLNKAQVMGHTGKDAKILNDKNGNPFAVTFSIATTEYFKDKETGETKDHTEWHNIICYNKKIFSMLEKYALKGRLIYVEGKLHTSQYDKDGESSKRYSTQIIAERIRLVDKKEGEKEIAE